ncbi:hypothetical protein CMU91_15145 [Elizabethkingia anophelis]|nr:hypothetical protein [Elizabethkingia anophelis]
MKRNEDENKSLSELIKNIDKEAFSLREYPDSFVNNIGDSILNNTNKASKLLKGNNVLNIIVFVLFIGSIIMLVLSLVYKNKVDSVLISSQNKEYDSITHLILGAKDSGNAYRVQYVVEDSKILTYPSLIKEHDQLKFLKDSLEEYKEFEKALLKRYDIKLTRTIDGNKKILNIEAKTIEERNKMDRDFEKKSLPLIRKILKTDTIKK